MRVIREFVGVDLGEEPVLDETTVCKFRHLLEEHELTEKLFLTVNHYLALKGMKVSCGTIADATIISAPSSTKNKDNERDPEMHPSCEVDTRVDWNNLTPWLLHHYSNLNATTSQSVPALSIGNFHQHSSVQQ